ncbi:MAG: bifunctional oligoribonuclease/PAP phosphatase NrnA [Deltaproteobacteria bacterium]|nr:bifunctional oligoribonuclease/PAP phosphatase NrnA [Deltaproteobacteria bacterium]
MIEKIKRVLEHENKFLVTTHVDPDGDAIGSMFGMYFFLKAIGKTVRVYLKDSVPYRYAFLPGPEKIEKDLKNLGQEVILVLDCGDIKRIGDEYNLLTEDRFIVNIDHHETNGMFGKINHVLKDASSTAEILYDIFMQFGAPITYEIALNIYTGIFTDTGSFRFPNTTEKCFRVCGEMLHFGVSPSYVAQMVYENHPRERFLLLSEVLRTLEVSEGGDVGIVLLTSEMFKKVNANYEHSDGFVEYIKEIKGIKVAILIRELENGKCKVSMRSKDNVNVGRICGKFGGGGHKNAAGCILEGKPEEVREKVKKVLSEEL